MRWISVHKKLPEAGERVLFCTVGGFVGEGYWGNDGRVHRYNGYDIEETLGMVTHWANMPKPKEVMGNNG